MTMFPSPMPPMPPEIVEAAQANPDTFADALAAGMESFSDAMATGGDVGGAFEAMGDVMGPMMGDMGVSPEVFEAAGDAFGAAVGPAMMMGPADAGGPEMGAMMQDAVVMMCPEGADMPAPVMDAMMDMGQGMADTGAMPHDVAGDMMAPPGDDMYPLPTDANGDPVVVPGDPASCPAEACQAPPADGACAAMGEPMMMPEGGYDHVPMAPDMQMPDPAAFDPNLAADSQVAMDPAAGDAGTFEMAPPDPTGALSGADNIAPMGPNDTNVSLGLDPDGSAPADASAADAMGSAFGDAPAADMGQPNQDMNAMNDAFGDQPNQDMGGAANAADAAIGAALDGAASQDAAAAAPAEPNVNDPAADSAAAFEEAQNTNDDTDPSAGMG